MSAFAATVERGTVPRRRGAAGPAPSLPSVAGYELQAVLGRGRHSVVYLARHAGGGGRVALKVARAMQREGKDFESEFTVQAALAHRHVVRVFEHGTSEGAAYLAMEYAAGGSLAAHAGHLDTAGAASLLGQAAGGLAWLHGKGWVHRDVKPDNLLLRADGSLALGDFGCACREGAAAAPPGRVMGTPRYAAPEQTEGAPARAAADVYSLGACFYELLAGEPLFPGETLTELLGQHLLAPVPRLAPEQAAWQPLLDAMLAKDPAHRPRDGRAVLAELVRARHSVLRPRGRGSLHESRNSP